MSGARLLFFVLAAGFAAAGCTYDSCVQADSGMDAATDSDTDTDKDTGTETDTDTDTDSSTDTEACVVEDPFHPEECPPIDPADAKVRYVDAVVATPGDGASWSTAVSKLQPAVDSCRCVAIALGEPCQVWVAGGTYTTDPGNPCDTFWLRPDVELYGGFMGEETSLDERDWNVNATTLDGGGVAYHVVRGATGATIDGFWITGGNAYSEETGFEAQQHKHGGGMFNNASSPTVANCTFEGNSAEHGGGMYNVSSSPTVTDCVFSDNAASNGGGGMCNNDSSPTMVSCTFSNNAAGDDGGGMFNLYGLPTVVSCTFSNNAAGDDGGGMYNFYGLPIVTRCVFSNNAASDDGGGMFNFVSSSIVTSCVFEGNSTTGDGGGMFNWSNAAAPIVTGCVFSNNSAGDNGGGIKNHSALTMTNCTFFGNSAGDLGGALFNWSDEATVTNCVLREDSAIAPSGEIYTGFGSHALILTYSSVEGGCTVDAGCTTDATGNIDADPLFVNDDADAGVIDLRLQNSSSCIDTGSTDALPADTADLDDDGDVLEDVPFDFDGNPRVVGTSVDMGAYEFQP